MTQHEIEIIIRGKPGTGKTTLGYVLQNYLQSKGVKAVFTDQEELFQPEIIRLGSETNLDRIKQNIVVNIKAEQAPRI